MKKIIFINRFFYPDQSATSQILSDLLFNIQSEINAELHVVTSRNSYQGDKRFLASEIINGVKVHRIWASNFGRSFLPGRALDYLSFYISALFTLLLLTRKDDILIAKTDPPVISFFAFIVCKCKKGILINWLQDLFPEVAVELGFIKSNSIQCRLLKYIKDVSLRAAVKNVAIGEKMVLKINAAGVLREKIIAIPNWNVNDDTTYVEKAVNPLVKEWGLNGKFVISYSGNFGRAHEYEPVCALINKLKDMNDLVFLFIGGGKYYDDLMVYVENNNINNVIFKPYQPREVLNQSLSVADIHLISLRPELEGLIVPSKFFGLASIGALVLYLGDCQGEIGSIIRTHDCGICCNSADIDVIVEILNNIKAHSQISHLLRTNIKKIYLDKYQPRMAYAAWARLLNEI